MAITINQEPEELSPAYNDLVHVVSSTNYTQPNFKYVCDVYVNGSSTISHRQSIPPHPSYGTGVYNPARILESYLSKDFDLDSGKAVACTNSSITYIVKFGEEYGLTSSGTTVYADLTIASKKYIWNSVFDWEDWCSFDYSKYVSGNAASQFLTNSPDNKKVYIDENYNSGNEFVYAITESSGSIYYLNVFTYNSSNALIGVYKIRNLYQAFSQDNEKVVKFPCGVNLNSINATYKTVVSGSSTIINSSVAYYYIYASKFSGTVSIPIQKVFYIERTCSRYPLYEIYFQNKLGGYDTFVFNMKSNVKLDIKRETFKSNLGLTNSAYSYDKLPSKRFSTQYSTVIDDSLTLRSDYINEATLLWLEELITSPDVYMLRGTNYVPITISNPSFERKQVANERLFNLTIDIKLSYKRNRQRF